MAESVPHAGEGSDSGRTSALTVIDPVTVNFTSVFH